MAFTKATRSNVDNVPLSSLKIELFDRSAMNKYFGLKKMKNDDPITTLLGKDKISKKSTGCGGEATPVMDEVTKNVAFTTIKVKASYCDEDLLDKLVGKGMQANAEPDEIGDIISVCVEEGAELDLIRLAFLGDTTINNTSILNEGLDVADYNIKDGFIKQIITGVTGKTIKKITLNPDQLLANVQEAKQALHFSARRDAVLLATSNLYSKIESLTMTNSNDTAQKRMIDGVETLYFNGFKVVELEEVSTYLYADYRDPKDFMILTPLSNLVVALDRDYISVDKWDYAPKEEIWYLKAKYQADFKIRHDASLVYIAE